MKVKKMQTKQINEILKNNELDYKAKLEEVMKIHGVTIKNPKAVMHRCNKDKKQFDVYFQVIPVASGLSFDEASLLVKAINNEEEVVEIEEEDF